jgi:dihydrofolate synthase/folylpolyglutamate synthase
MKKKDRHASYDSVLDELFDLQRFSVKMGLDNITRLCQFLGNPQQAYSAIHIAGTNGKGSTSIMIQKILAGHGLQTGLYTSPHLLDFRERIRINRDFIEPGFISDFWRKIAKEVAALKATFFDTTTAMAFKYFQEKKVDAAVIETGLGGRLDSTNIINPEAVVLTPIHIDHIPQLGADLKNIAAEKAAIIKNGVTLFCADQLPEVARVIGEFSTGVAAGYLFGQAVEYRIENCSTRGTVFGFVDKLRQDSFRDLRLNLLGEFQVRNALLAYLTARWFLEKRRIRFNPEILRQVFDQIEWPGRLQCVLQQPRIYFDVSHNYSGFETTLEFIRSNFNPAAVVLLLGLLADKEYDRIVQLIVKDFKRITVTEPINERKLDGETLAAVFCKYGTKADLFKNPHQAFEFCVKNMHRHDALFVMGSHFLVGELSKSINEKSLTYNL